MEPVVKDVDDDEEQTDTDRMEGEDSASSPSQSRSPSVYAQETDLDVFDGYWFNGRHSVLICDDEDDPEPVVEPTQPTQTIEPPTPTKREEEDDWDFVEAGVDEERNGTKGTSLFARGVVDRYKLAVFRKSTPSRHGGKGRETLSFRNKKSVSKFPPVHGGNDRTRGSFFVLLFASVFSPTLCS